MTGGLAGLGRLLSRLGDFATEKDLFPSEGLPSVNQCERESKKPTIWMRHPLLNFAVKSGCFIVIVKAKTEHAALTHNEIDEKWSENAQGLTLPEKAWKNCSGMCECM